MNRKAIFVFVGIIMIAPVGRAHGSPLAPSKASDVVTLTSGGTPCSVAGGVAVNFQTLPDATFAPFSIPARRVLVVTGASFRVSGGVSSNHAKNFALYIAKPPSSVAATISTVVLTGDTALGQLGGGVATIPLAIVKAGVDLCVVASDINGGPADATAVVYGFFAKDK